MKLPLSPERMADVLEVAAARGWSEDGLVIDITASGSEVTVRPQAGEHVELYLQSARTYARPGIAPLWTPVPGATRAGWTYRAVSDA